MYRELVPLTLIPINSPFVSKRGRCRRDHSAHVTVCYEHTLHPASQASLLSRLPHSCVQQHPRLGEFNYTSFCMGHRVFRPKFLQCLLFERQHLQWKEGIDLTPLSSGAAPVITFAPSGYRKKILKYIFPFDNQQKG